MADKFTFLASFPPIQSAIKVGDTGMRIQFDVPESEMGNAVGLIGLRNVVLKVTVEAQPTKPETKPKHKTKTGDYDLPGLRGDG